MRFDVLEHRKAILSNLDDYTRTEIANKLRDAEREFEVVQVRNSGNDSEGLAKIFEAGCLVATYRMALRNKKEVKVRKLVLADEWQYTWGDL